jgi:DcaP outer membrane protein
MRRAATSIDRRSRLQCGRASGLAAVAGAVLVAGLSTAGVALAQSAAPASPQEIQELRAELDNIKAESDAAKAQEAERARKIAELQRRLDAAAGVPPAAVPPPATISDAEAAAETPRESQPETTPPTRKGSFDIFGFAQVDYIQDFNRMDPAWDATLRVSKIPTIPDQFGSGGQSIISVRQSRFGVQADQEIAGKDLYVKFDFDLFGVGDNAGQTTFRLQNFYGTWGPLLIGQTDTLWMDGSIFPNTIDYWGPTGMVYLRNPQIRLTWKSGPNELAGAIEQPNNDVDPGQAREVDPALGGVQGTELMPDFTGRYRYTGDWGHVQIAGILRRVGFETLNTPSNEPKGSQLGWGVDVTSNIKPTKNDVIHLGVVFGAGIASYMNDGGTDLAPGGVASLTGPSAIHAEAVSLVGVIAYLDHQWTKEFSSSFGYSRNQVDNTSLQTADAFHVGQYASVNLLWTPDPHIMIGGEFIWGQLTKKDGATGDDSRVQFSAKYKFSSKDFFQ